MIGTDWFDQFEMRPTNLQAAGWSRQYKRVEVVQVPDRERPGDGEKTQMLQADIQSVLYEAVKRE